ncbi:hypothetical protein N1030_08275 [Desulfovibrio mangrovi]|uniref:hypothetical protein n=1 Tax=Desulfovibrio mangrovi TaxID=2976983 RepID=UPI0022459D7B|nr:hypothetical protein [Desulfovibrio mangrovi]UZP69219.1 hypothetical protein N1030_08275 [Desulfovibrio mangrovi]
MKVLLPGMANGTATDSKGDYPQQKNQPPHAAPLHFWRIITSIDGPQTLQKPPMFSTAHKKSKSPRFKY